MNEMLNKEDEQLLKGIRVLFFAMVGMLALLLLLAIVFTQVMGPVSYTHLTLPTTERV